MRRRGAVLGVGVVVFGLAALVMPGWVGVPGRHTDGGGLIESSPGSTFQMIMGPDHPGAEWSYAIFLCPTDPSDPPRLVEVNATGLVGGGTYLGARFLEHPERSGDILQNGTGFPPTGPEPSLFLPIAGQSLSTACEDGSTPSQVFMGLRLGPDGGGGWTGEEIVYDHRWGRSTLVLDHAFVFCGDTVSTADCDEWRAQRETQGTPTPAAS